MQTVKTDNGEFMVGVDWLSISIPYGSLVSQLDNDKDGSLKRVLSQPMRKLYNLISGMDDLQSGGGRAPFNVSIHSKKGGFTYYESTKLRYSLIEFTGVGCQRIYEYGWMNSILSDWNERITRLDIACDINTDVSPMAFAKGRDEDGSKFNSKSTFVSDSGETCYIGSRKSDRYSRVYRYSEPHPRANLLRVEFVLKGSYARTAAKEVSMGNVIPEIAKGLFLAFGWKDFSSLITGNVLSLPSAPRETHQGKTERWLLTQVLSAIRGMVESGNVEFVSIFQERIEEIRKGGNITP